MEYDYLIFVIFFLPRQEENKLKIFKGFANFDLFPLHVTTSSISDFSGLSWLLTSSKNLIFTHWNPCIYNFPN